MTTDFDPEIRKIIRRLRPVDDAMFTCLFSFGSFARRCILAGTVLHDLWSDDPGKMKNPLTRY